MDTKSIIAKFHREQATHVIVNPWGNIPVKKLHSAGVSSHSGAPISEVEDAFGERFIVRDSKLAALPGARS